MKKYFDNKKKIILSLIYSVLIIFCGTTFARWIWESTEGQRTDIAFLIEDHEAGYSCSADGGGEIIANEAIIMPAPCTSSENVIMREITTDVDIENNDVFVSLDLWLNVNELGQGLSESTNFKYTVTTSSTSCNTDVLASGNFNGKVVGDKVNLINIEHITSASNKYYLYIWLDEEETNPNTANQNFNLSLDGSCSGVSNAVEAPVLDEGMIPVVISDDGVVTTIDENDDNWYNYVDKKWANMVLVNENATDSVDGSKSREYYLNNPGTTVLQSDILAYYTWIPRYKYRIWTVDANTITEPQTINILFESKDEEFVSGTTVGSYRTHPAFWWDVNSDGNRTQNEMLPGIWVGKFETTGTADKPTILPNTTSLVNQNVSTQFQTSLKFSGGVMNSSTGNVKFGGNGTYGLTFDTDSHMMKNSEWGAVAYLSHSQYGINKKIYINNSSSYYTGRSAGAVGSDEIITSVGGSYNWIGQPVTDTDTYGTATDTTLGTNASTTGNVTGIYDMSGGSYEYVMGNHGKTIGSSGFSILPLSKYYDLYSSDIFSGNHTINMSLCAIGTCGGHALFETSGWYSEFSGFVSNTEQWFIRGGFSGGSSGGAFVSSYYSGAEYGYFSFRSVLIPQDMVNVTFDANGGIISSDISYTNPGEHIYMVPYTGDYKFELWGAQGGSSKYNIDSTGSVVAGGFGGYVSGNIRLLSNESMYIYVGGKGNDGVAATKVDGGYNGGGAGGTQYQGGAGGGGATDVRLALGNLGSRIIVAGGGAGSSNYTGAVSGGTGGGLTGYSGKLNVSSVSHTLATGGSQISGGTGGGATGEGGTFGIGGAAEVYGHGGGGGGGYYGGGGGGFTDSGVSSGAGGSSYISGHSGSVAITSENDITPKSGCTTGTSDILCSVHYSVKYFTDTIMIDGAGYSWTNIKGSLQQMPNPSGGYYASGVGHSGNGVVKISLLPVSSAVKKIFYGDYYGEMPEPSKKGYNFLGWYTESDGGELVTNTTLMVDKNNHTLYARWEELPTYTILYDANGGSGAPSSQIKIHGETLTLSSTVPIKNGYRFLGWSTDSVATSPTYDVGGSYTANEGATLYAVWTIASPVSSYSCANKSVGSEPYVLTYTGNCTVIDDGGINWRIKFLTSGTLTSLHNIEIDAFLVGGGGGGGDITGWSDHHYYSGGGGGGGYTTTGSKILSANQPYAITIGAGGAGRTNGGTTSAFSLSAAGGEGSTGPSGGDGGSGGGAGGWKDEVYGGNGGSDGGSGGDGGYKNNYHGGDGQGTTTREFGESTGTLYAGGGGGGPGSTSKNYHSGTGGAGGGATGKTSASANTGGGGGGGYKYGSAGSGGSGIVVIRNVRKYGCSSTGVSTIDLDFSYTGFCEEIDDGGGNWRIKFTTSGIFTTVSDVEIDVFLVGGGGGGGDITGLTDHHYYSGGGGGGGYTTNGSVTLSKSNIYNVVVGAGGAGRVNGGTTSAFSLSAAGGEGSTGPSGGDGGSGGGAGGWKDEIYGGNGGSNGGSGGSGGYNNNYSGGSGQGTTTREFGEESGTLYAGGGGGGPGSTSKDYHSGTGGAGGGATGKTSASANTGGGGGGGYKYGSAGSGGSGIVVIRNKR